MANDDQKGSNKENDAKESVKEHEGGGSMAKKGTKTDAENISGDESKKSNTDHVKTDEEHSDEVAGDEHKKNSSKDLKPKTSQGHAWQAVWDASRGAWYFWNSETQETTWENPLEKEKKAIDSSSTNEKEEINVEENFKSVAKMTDEEVAEMCGIDPDLAYLDPTMYATEIHQARMGGAGAGSSSVYRAEGKFDSRTGKFIPQAKITHAFDRQTNDLNRQQSQFHHHQADRQLNAFFDVKQFEEQRKRQNEAVSLETDEQGRVKRPRPSKKELKFFKERAKEKKASKNSWLKN